VVGCIGLCGVGCFVLGVYFQTGVALAIIGGEYPIF
jgi:hypothetical protein